MKLLIKKGRVVDPVGGIGGVMDVLIEEGRVAIIGSDIEDPDAPIIHAQGLVVSAGLVDMHVHLREPGFTHKESIRSGALAAAHGGFTTVACMPNTRPTIDCPEQIEFIKARGKAACGVHILPIAALSKGQMGETLTDQTALKNAGAVALSDDGLPVQNANLLRDGLIRSKRLALPILSHCEDGDMVQNYAVNEGRISRKLGIPGRPAIAEELMVMRDAMLAEETGSALHICHISTAGSVDIVRKFKKRGVPITCETCPHYFTLTEDAILEKGTLARINPPLRTKHDVEAIIVGLQDGTIDAIATDHAPHSIQEKKKPLESAPSGAVGLETALAVTLTQLYHTEKLDLSSILRTLTFNPATILGQHSGRLCLGGDADIVIFDPNQPWTVDATQFVSKGQNTPFDGMELKGRVKYTIVGGNIIYQDQP